MQLQDATMHHVYCIPSAAHLLDYSQCGCCMQLAHMDRIAVRGCMYGWHGSVHWCLDYLGSSANQHVCWWPPVAASGWFIAVTCAIWSVQAHLDDGLRYEPHRHLGWYHLGMVHKQQQRLAEAENCLRVSVGLSLTAPVMSFSKLPRLL